MSKSKQKRNKESMKVAEMNKRIIKLRLKRTTYVMTDLDLMLLNDGEYKSNIKENNKKYKPKKKKKKWTKVDVLKF